MDLKDALTNWKQALNSQIGDTTEEIEHRRANNVDAVALRDDLVALLEWIDTIPEPARRAVMAALQWNPFTSPPRDYSTPPAPSKPLA